jgi:hypothetical protein
VIGDADFQAELGEMIGGGEADAGRAAGDDGDGIRGEGGMGHDFSGNFEARAESNSAAFSLDSLVNTSVSRAAVRRRRLDAPEA